MMGKTLVNKWKKKFNRNLVSYFRLSDQDILIARLHYIHNVMEIPQEEILKWSGILQLREHRLKQRHEFLKLIGRAQYDPTKDLYVSLKALCVGTDEEFAMNVAKTAYKKFENFLRQL